MKRGFEGLLAVCLSLCLGGAAFAGGVVEIDVTKTPVDPVVGGGTPAVYHTMADFAAAYAATPGSFADYSTITLYNNDSTLPGNVVLSGDRTAIPPLTPITLAGNGGVQTLGVGYTGSISDDAGGILVLKQMDDFQVNNINFTGGRVAPSEVDIGTGTIHARGGGALYIYDTDLVNMTNVTFSNNQVTLPASNIDALEIGIGGGGVLIVDKGVAMNTTFTDAQFLNNAVTGPTSRAGGLPGASGGGLYVSSEYANNAVALNTNGGSLTEFTGNTVNGLANGIHLHADQVGLTTSLTMNNGAGSHTLMNDPLTASGAGAIAIAFNGADTTSRWSLGGKSNLTAATTSSITIDNGAFHLINGGTLDMGFATVSTFTIGTGLNTPELGLSLNGASASSSITANTINIQAGTALVITGISGAVDGTYKDVLVANAYTSDPDGLSFPGANGVTYTLNFNAVTNNYDLVVNGTQTLVELSGNPMWRPTDSARLAPNIHAPLRNDLDALFAQGGDIEALRALDPDAARRLLGFNSIYYGSSIMNASYAIRDNRKGLVRHIGTQQDIYREALLSGLMTADSGARSNGALAAVPPNCAPQSMWNIWAGVDKRWINQDTDGGVAGYEYNPYSLTLGLDRNIGNFVFGVAGQYDYGKVKSDVGNYTEIKAETWTLGAYASYNSNNFYVDLGVQYGWGNNKERTSFAPAYAIQHNGKYDTNVFGANLEAGYAISLGQPASAFRIIPHAGLDYSHVWQDAFTESSTGGVGRRFSKANYDVFETPVGVRFEKSFSSGTSVFTPYVDAAYSHNFADDYAKTNVFAAGAPVNTSWVANGVKSGRDAFLLAAGINGVINQRVTAGIAYNLEMRRNYTEHRGVFQIGVGF